MGLLALPPRPPPAERFVAANGFPCGPYPPPFPPPATQYLPEVSNPFGVGAEVGPGAPTPDVGSLNDVGI